MATACKTEYKTETLNTKESRNGKISPGLEMKMISPYKLHFMVQILS